MGEFKLAGTAVLVAALVMPVVVLAGKWLGAGPYFWFHLAALAIVWFLATLTLVVPLVGTLRWVLERPTWLTRNRTFAVVATGAASTGGLAWYLVPWAAGLRPWIPVEAGFATGVGLAVVLVAARRERTYLRSRPMTVQHLRNIAGGYVLFWAFTLWPGSLQVRAAEGDHWSSLATEEYFGASAPLIREYRKPLGTARLPYRDGTVDLSAGLPLSPFVIVLDFDVTGQMTGFNGRAIYVWFFGITWRVFGPPLSVWN